jgi:hypothetical protein
MEIWGWVVLSLSVSIRLLCELSLRRFTQLKWTFVSDETHGARWPKFSLYLLFLTVIQYTSCCRLARILLSRAPCLRIGFRKSENWRLLITRFAAMWRRWDHIWDCLIYSFCLSISLYFYKVDWDLLQVWWMQFLSSSYKVVHCRFSVWISSSADRSVSTSDLV